MCAGLDDWFRSPPDVSLQIQEERLAARLNRDFFVKPPEYSDSESGPKYRIPHLRFPLWHYCARCFRMKKTTLFGGQPKCMEPTCSKSKFGCRMIPVRIVTVCENGHIEDFPFRRWIGCKCASNDDCEMFFKAGRSAASLASIKIECAKCDQKRSLAGAFEEGALASMNVPCSGAQPWLGRETGSQSCPARLQTVQRGSSNIYFPAVQSSIYIPPAQNAETDDIRRVLDEPGRFERLFEEALRRARWCSNNPVYMESPGDGASTSTSGRLSAPSIAASITAPMTGTVANLRHRPTTFVQDLASRLRCSKCAGANRRPATTLLQLVQRPRQAAPET